MGLHRAGFDVTGVDINPQPHYPFRFVQGDALDPPVDVSEFDLIWASPPCQAHTSLAGMWNARKGHPNLIPETRALLRESGTDYVIENVPGAPLEQAVKLCGSMFGLRCDVAELRRHRYFECSFLVLTPECVHGNVPQTIGVYGKTSRNGSDKENRLKTITVTGHTPQQNVVRNEIRETFTADQAREAMGIDWMPLKALSQAIPPAYSEFLARQWS